MNATPPPNDAAQTPPDGQTSSEGMSKNEAELIAALRELGAFSFDSYGSLGDVLLGIEQQVGDKLTRFANTPVVTKLDEIKVFSAEDFAAPADGEEEDASVFLVQLYDSAKEPVCAITVPAKLFFYLLEFALGGEADDGASFENMQISEAENAVFFVFCQSVADGLHAGISGYSDLKELISGESGETENAAAWIESNELITIKLAVETGSLTETILLFVPIQMLEPMREPPVVEEEVVEEVLDLDWVQGLNRAIDKTSVDLCMVLANSELNLGDIGRLVKGQQLDVGLSMKNIPVCDLEGNVLFCADLEMPGEERQLRVTGGIRIQKGADNDLFN